MAATVTALQAPAPAIPMRTAEELKKEHPAYPARKTEWLFFGDSYYGGSRYLKTTYILKHPNEQDADYKHRLAVACYYNFCQEIVDLYTSYLFQKPPEIDYGTLAKDDLFSTFLQDVDLKGSSLSTFLREAQRKAGIYGHLIVVVDKPKGSLAVQTRQDEKELNQRPYAYWIRPQNLLDWKYERIGTEGYRLTYIKIKESDDPERYRIWTTAAWELWEIKKHIATLIESGENPIGEIPAAILYNLRSEEDLVGRSDLNDIAYINRHITNLCSWNDENIENTTFAMLAKAKRQSGQGATETDVVGPSTIIEYDPELPNDKPYWLEPPGVSQDVFDKRLDRDIAEIHRIAKMGGVGATETSKEPKSGVALELEFRMMNSTLAEKADNIEEAHARIAKLYAKWMDLAWTGKIDYPDDFAVEDLALDLENAIQATALRIGARFNTEMRKRLARIALPKLEPEKKREVESEIEAQKDFFMPAEFALLLQNNLTNPVDVLMALRGIEEKEAIKILERNKELNDKYGSAPKAPNLSNLIGGQKDRDQEEGTDA